MIWRFRNIDTAPVAKEQGQSKLKKYTCIGAVAAAGLFGGVLNGDSINQSHNQQFVPNEIEYELDYPTAPPLLNLVPAPQEVTENAESAAMIDKKINEYAKECNLTLAKPDEFINQVYNSENYYQILDSLNGYFASFDIKISTLKELDPVADKYGLHERSILTDDYIDEYVNVKYLKDSVATLMNGLRYVPVEYIKLAGIEEIVIVKAFGDKTPSVIKSPVSGNSAIGGIAALDNHIIYECAYSFGHSSISTDITLHEIGHFIHRAISQNNQFNNQFTHLNPEGFKYNDFISYEQHKDAVMCPYGANNRQEDVATILQEFDSGGPDEAFYASPVVKQKARLVIANIDKLVPNIARYYGLLESLEH